MITEEKIKEIKKLIRSGVPPGEVREDLLGQGYTEEDLKKVFTAHQYDMRSWYLSFAVILLLVGIWLFLRSESWITLLFSVLLFFAYFRENERVKKNNTPS
jgi:hypothetical protein